MSIANKLCVTNQLYGCEGGGWWLRFDYMIFTITKGEKGKVGILKQLKYRLGKIGECMKSLKISKW